MKIWLTFLLGFFTLLSCQNSSIKEPNDNISTYKTLKVNQLNYSLTIQIVDSLLFYKDKHNIKHKDKPIEKITDLATAKKMLDGIVEFREYENNAYLRRILFRNGDIYNAQDVGESFVAYFPTEDVILFEGGHTIDVSYNLTSGKVTEDAGNPEYIVTSPNLQYRLNGAFDGQQCISYFIEKRIDGQFQKVIDLSEVFEKNQQRLCTISEEFWTDDTTLLMKEYFPNSDVIPIFYRVFIHKAEKPKIESKKVLKSANPLDFIPEGFVIYKQDGHDLIKRDFNNDGLIDVAMIIKGTDKSNFVKNQFDVVVDRNPRGIIILLNKGKQYELALKNYDCFLSENEDGGVYFAPQLDIEFKNQRLSIAYRHGRYGYEDFIFRYQNRDFELTEYNASSNNGPVVLDETSINFLTGEYLYRNNINIVAESNADEIFEETKKIIEVKELIRLSEIRRFDGLDLSRVYSENIENQK
jgi:hypothetical protein